MIIGDSPTHIVIAFDISKTELARHRRVHRKPAGRGRRGKTSMTEIVDLTLLSSPFEGEVKANPTGSAEGPLEKHEFRLYQSASATY
jgi:hypothetical protein